MTTNRTTRRPTDVNYLFVMSSVNAGPEVKNPERPNGLLKSPADRTCVDGLEEVQASLRLLLEARIYAQDCHRDEWDFAVEIDRLEAIGLTVSQLRWLVCQGYVEHAAELASAGNGHRVFRKLGTLTMTKKTCVVLTEAGAALVRVVPVRLLAAPRDRSGPERDVPTWQKTYRELRLGDFVVKRFRVPAPSQELILDAFEEEGWPSHLDDPLPPHPNVDPKRRLHDTIDRLNRSQKNRLIRFHGDGTGQAVRWDFLIASR